MTSCIPVSVITVEYLPPMYRYRNSRYLTRYIGK